MDKNLLKVIPILCSIFLCESALAETVVDETKTGPNGGTVNVQVDDYSSGEAVAVSVSGKNGKSAYVRVDSEGYKEVARSGDKGTVHISTDSSGNKTIEGPRNKNVQIVPGESVTVSEGSLNLVEVSKNEDGGATIDIKGTTATITPNEDGSVTATGPDGTATKDGDTTTVTTGHGDTQKTKTFDNTKKPSRPRRTKNPS